MAEGGPRRRHAGAELAVEVVRRGKTWAEPPLADALIERAARAALDAASNAAAGYEVTVLLTGDQEMRELNRMWRSKDAPTNVLSFPSGNADGFLGDIVLARETVLKESQESGVKPEDHVAHLVVHGVLHLLGFDHVNDDEAERMEALERAALGALGIADPYATQAMAEHAP
jgi:probable rRNA maturation factor